MKYFQFCAVVLILNLVIVDPVFAGGIADRIKSWLLGPEAQASTIKDYQLELDHIAQRCVQCHNGERATNITVKNADAPLQYSMSGAQVNHPVGMVYDDYAITKSREFMPRLLLDSNISLIDGKVTCVSCHRLKKMNVSESVSVVRWKPGRTMRAGAESCDASTELTMGSREEDLCLACHRL